MKFKVTFVFILYFIVSVGVAWLLLNEIRWNQTRKNKELFSYQVDSYLFSLKERYNRNAVALLGLEGFINASDYVTYEEWDKNIANLELNKNFPAISWISYVSRLPQQDQEQFIEDIRAQGIDYRIWPNSYDAYSYPLVYISPSSFSNLMGYNLYANPSLRESLDKSIETRALTEATSFSTKFGKLKKSERVFFLPIVHPDTEQVTGWISANLNFATIIQQTFNGLNLKDFKVQVYAGNNQDLNNLVYQYNDSNDNPDQLVIKKLLEFGSTKWTFLFKSDLPSQNLVSAPIFFIVLFFLLISLSVGLFLYFYYLKKSNPGLNENLPEKKILAATQYAFIATDTRGIIRYFNPAAERLLGYKAEELVGRQTPGAFHDQQEMIERAQELSQIMGREVKPEFEVFVTMAERNTPENRRWTYIKKDQTRITVQLSVTPLRNPNGVLEGYLGVAIESSLISL